MHGKTWVPHTTRLCHFFSTSGEHVDVKSRSYMMEQGRTLLQATAMSGSGSLFKKKRVFVTPKVSIMVTAKTKV